jgi:hypothetical protein
MDRSELAAFIATDLDALLVEAGIASTDTPDGLGPILDAVEAVAPVDLLPTWLPPLGRYMALDRIVTRLAAQMDVSLSGDSYRLSQLFTQAKALRDEAKASVSWIVEPVTPDADAFPAAVPYAVIVPGPQW